MTSALKQQLVSTFDNNPEIKLDELAEAFGLELETVKLVLETAGSRRMEEVGTLYHGSRRLFKQSVLRKVAEKVEDLISGGDDQHVQLKACELVLKVETGMMSPKNILNQFNGSITINDINDIIAKRINSTELARPVLDVEAC